MNCLALRILPAVIFLLVGCGSEPAFDQVYTRITPPVLLSGNPILQPQGTPILTITGKVGVTNQQGQIVMDREMIESVGLVEYAVEDLFESEIRIFRGVLMRDLLEVWQVQADATTLDILALNDYQVDVPIALVQNYPVLFALQQDGEYMQPDYRGPAMLVFPYEYYPAATELSDPRYWIWQIQAIQVE